MLVAMRKAAFVIMAILAGFTSSMMAQETKIPICRKFMEQYGQNMSMNRPLGKAVSRFVMPD